MAVLYTNNATTTLASSISNSATSLTVAIGDGAKFPNPTAGDFFYVTLTSGNTVEIAKVTSRLSDTFTVIRAQDGTSAASFVSGATVELRITAGMLDQLKLDASANSSGSGSELPAGAFDYGSIAVAADVEVDYGSL